MTGERLPSASPTSSSDHLCLLRCRLSIRLERQRWPNRSRHVESRCARQRHVAMREGTVWIRLPAPFRSPHKAARAAIPLEWPAACIDMKPPKLHRGSKSIGRRRCELSWKAGSHRAESGPDAIGLLASAKCTNEENYLVQKLARQVIGTHNIDHCARLCHSSTVAGLTMCFRFRGDEQLHGRRA